MCQEGHSQRQWQEGVSLSYFYFAQPVLALNAYRVQALFEMLEIQQ